MKKYRSVSLAICAIVFGASVGWFLRAWRASSSDSSAKTVIEGVVDAPTKLLTTKADPREEEFRVSQGASKWLLLLSWADQATLEDMPRLVRLAKGNDEALKVLAARWIELNPQHMFESLAKEAAAGNYLGDTQKLFEILFEEWLKRDQEAAIAALSDRTLPAGTGLRMSMSNEVMQRDPERGLRLLKEWNIDHYTPDLRKLEEFAQRDPLRAARAALEAGSSHGARSALTAIGAAWAKQDPKSAMEFAAKLNTWQRSNLGHGALKAWAEKDPKAAAEFLNQAKADFRQEVASSLIEAWSANDPQAAFDWSQDTLKGEAKVKAIGDVIRATAAKNVEEAKAIVDQLEPSHGKNLAAASLVAAWLKEDMFNSGHKPETLAKRDAALEWLGSLSDKEAARHALNEHYWRIFPGGDSEVARDFLAKNADIAPDMFWVQTARKSAQQDPNTAMEWAQSLPEGKRAIALSSAVSTWFEAQPEAATTWATKLPPGPTREGAFRQLVISAGIAPEEQAVRWFQAVLESDRAFVKRAMEESNLSEFLKERARKAFGN